MILNCFSCCHVHPAKASGLPLALAALTVLAWCGGSAAAATAKAKVVYAHEMPSYQKDDATDALQAAIDSGAQRVIVSAGRPWVLSHQINIFNRHGLTLKFEPGVVVRIKKGSFQPTGASLFKIRNSDDIVINGYGAQWQMPKKAFQDPKLYKPSEWRNSLSIRGCNRVTVRGLTLIGSGGDGVYIDGSRGKDARPFSSDIVLEDVRALGHHRQGMSVISVDGLRVERCEFSGTEGTDPQAGIDFEPDNPAQRLTDIVIRDCRFENNAGAAIKVFAANLTGDSPAISIEVEHAEVDGGRYGFVVSDYGLGAEKGRHGRIVFHDAVIRGTRGAGLLLRNKTSAAKDVDVRFEKILLLNVATDADQLGALNAPVILEARDDSVGRLPVGGVVFDDITIRDEHSRPCIKAVFAKDALKAKGLSNIRGDFTVLNEKSQPPALGDLNPSVKVSFRRASSSQAKGSPTR